MISSKRHILIPVAALEAAARILDPSVNSYPGLMLSGSEESAKKFHDDVQLVAEVVAQLASRSVPLQ